MAYIYKVTNTINGKCYVGATTRTARQRMSEHIKASRLSSPTIPLHAAIKKYGSEHFSCEVLEECCDEERHDKEILWISKLQSVSNGYNVSLGGKGKSTINYSLLKDKLLETLSIKEASRIVGCDVGIARIFSHKENIYHLMKDRDVQYSLFSKPVVGYFDNNETLIFKSCHSAAIYCSSTLSAKGTTTSISSHISDVCKGKRKSAYGVVWKYL